jgi:hypothetical protein
MPERLAATSTPVSFSGVTALRRYWRWLGSGLRLTIGGRVVFRAVIVVGSGTVFLDPITNGDQGGNEGGVVLGGIIFMLVAVVAADAAFRALRLGVRRISQHG